MRPVAERRALRLLAATQVIRVRFGYRELLGGEACGPMRAVAHGLLLGEATGAPVVISWRQFNRVGGFLGAYGFGHNAVLSHIKVEKDGLGLPVLA